MFHYMQFLNATGRRLKIDLVKSNKSIREKQRNNVPLSSKAGITQFRYNNGRPSVIPNMSVAHLTQVRLFS